MMGQTKTQISEQKPMKYIEHGGGCEVISNDGTLKIELHHATKMEGAMENEFYYTEVYFLEDGGWQRAINSDTYRTKEDFIKAIDGTEEFTQAIKDFEQTNH